MNDPIKDMYDDIYSEMQEDGTTPVDMLQGGVDDAMDEVRHYIRYLHPEWSDKQVGAEINKVLNEALTPYITKENTSAND